MSIPDLATQIVNLVVSSSNDSCSSTLFIAGNKSSGKSTLLHSFLEKTDTPRETLVLEYSFGRKTIQKEGIEKNVCHVWEFGGSLDSLKNVLSAVPVRGKYSFCIMVDLSKIKNLWHTLETCIQAYQEVFLKAKNYPELLIIGGKYDIFKNYDAEIKKIICTTLRSLALLLNCSVIFYSSKDSSLVRRAKEVLHGISFGSGFPTKDKITHVSKPLFIPKNFDSWDSLGTSLSTLEQVKTRHLSFVPLETEPSTTKSSEPSVTAYAEPMLDSLLTTKYNELHNNAISYFEEPDRESRSNRDSDRIIL